MAMITKHHNFWSMSWWLGFFVIAPPLCATLYDHKVNCYIRLLHIYHKKITLYNTKRNNNTIYHPKLEPTIDWIIFYPYQISKDWWTSEQVFTPTTSTTYSNNVVWNAIIWTLLREENIVCLYIIWEYTH